MYKMSNFFLKMNVCRGAVTSHSEKPYSPGDKSASATSLFFIVYLYVFIKAYELVLVIILAFLFTKLSCKHTR